MDVSFPSRAFSGWYGLVLGLLFSNVLLFIGTPLDFFSLILFSILPIMVYQLSTWSDQRIKHKQRIWGAKKVAQRALPLFQIKASHTEIRLINHTQDLILAIQDLQAEFELHGVPILGLDCEWKPQSDSGPSKVAVLQLSARNLVLVIQMMQLSNVPDQLIEILTSPDILKCGVGVIEDCRKLLRDYNISVCGWVELQTVAQLNDHHINGTGLSSLASHLLHIQVDKRRNIQCSNWEAHTLSHSQIYYAAADAFLSRELFMAMFFRARTNLPPSEWGSRYVGTKALTIPNPSKSSSINPQTPESFKERIKQKTQLRNSPLYENCVVLNPEGSFMCFTNKKKINWYLSHELATKESDEPLTIRLNFQPRGQGHGPSDEYYSQEKENICVVCGLNESLVRHSVVPHAYRTHFDLALKSRSSHDVVLLCYLCNHKAMTLNAREMKRHLAVNSIPAKQTPFLVNQDIIQKKKEAAQLLKSPHLVPEKKAELQTAILEFLKKSSQEELTEKDLQDIMDLNPKYPNPDYVPPEKLLVQKLEKEDKLVSFVFEWRKYFFQSMKPTCLPKGWRVDRPFEPIEL